VAKHVKDLWAQCPAGYPREKQHRGSQLEGCGGTGTQRRRVNWSATSQWLKAGSSGGGRPSGGGWEVGGGVNGGGGGVAGGVDSGGRGEGESPPPSPSPSPGSLSLAIPTPTLMKQGFRKLD